MNRRTLVKQSLAGLGTAWAARPAAATPGIRIATSGFIWQNEIEEGIRTTAKFGFHGIEPFRSHITKYLDQPLALKKHLDAAGIALVTCSNGGPGMSTNLIDRAETAKTIEDHDRFARDFIAHFGCKHFKINCGARPEKGPTQDQLKTMADTLNAIGNRIAKYGLKLAPHPHIWSPLEREEEVARVMELTDPKVVGMVADTAHLNLGGMDPVKIMTRYWPRLTAVHFKDTEAKYRGFTGATPTREEHKRVNLYKNVGAGGGVDFPAVWKLLNSRGYQGWITLDLDPPRPGDGSIEHNLEINKGYLLEKLRVKL
jgi:sugar phosphate isomerase/epimerase